MGMRAHYVLLDSDDMTMVLDDRNAACEMLMGSSMGGMSVQDALNVLGVKNSDLKAMEKLLGPIPSYMKESSTSTGEKNRPGLEIEKSWHAIHFILNGDPWHGSGPLFNAVLGGKEVGEDMGYGCPRYVNPFQVVQTSTVLDRLSDEEFESKARSANFTGKGIYVYGDSLSESDIAELLDYFQQIREFFKAAADKGHGILIGII